MGNSRYEIFLKTVEFGSLTKAAMYFHYSQSAVSQSVKSLEQELGVTLLSRNKHGVCLTEDGKTLLPFLQDIVFARETLHNKIAEMQNLQSGKLRIAALTSMSCHWLPTHLQRFHEVYPNIQIDLKQGDYDQIIQWIQNREADIGCINRPAQTGFCFDKLFEDELTAVLPCSHPLAQQEVISLRQLEKETFLLVDSDYRELVARMFDQVKIKPQVPYWIQDDYTIMSMVEKGFGVSVMPRLVLRRTAYRIRQVKIRENRNRELGLITREKEALSWAGRQFMEKVRQDTEQDISESFWQDEI